MSQCPTGHRTTSFSVLDILDPNKFTSRRRQQHAGRRGERELDAYGAEKRRGVTRELEAGMEPSKEDYQSQSPTLAFSLFTLSTLLLFSKAFPFLFFCCNRIYVFTILCFVSVSLRRLLKWWALFYLLVIILLFFCDWSIVVFIF